MNFFPHHQRRIDALAETLITLRQTKRLTTKQLAALLGKPEAFVLAYESGKYRLDLPELVDIADAMGIDMIELIDLYQRKTN
uniref:helix-turn-helix domain-containing protein n=1 Tax=Pandoraea sputorum TaxID=93222 RepID=UPI00398A6CC2